MKYCILMIIQHEAASVAMIFAKHINVLAIRDNIIPIYLWLRHVSHVKHSTLYVAFLTKTGLRLLLYNDYSTLIGATKLLILLFTTSFANNWHPFRKFIYFWHAFFTVLIYLHLHVDTLKNEIPSELEVNCKGFI